MRHVVTFSYGISSWAAAKLVVARHGADGVTLINTDTRYEDEDTYAWGEAAAKNVGVPLLSIADGRDPWQVFVGERMLGNARVDPCSKRLKREMLAKWLAANCDQADTVVYFGIHWSEADRFERADRDTGELLGIRPRMAALGWVADSPLLWRPWIGYDELHAWAEREGLWKQKLYRLGFPHANCGGRCVKQGQKGWLHLLRTMPDRFMECEAKEEAFRRLLGKDVAILRDRRGGQTKPLPLRELRLRSQADSIFTDAECGDEAFGGCSCFAGDE